MDFSYSDEQLMLRDAARSWLAKAYPADRLAAIADGDGYDPAAFEQIAGHGWLEAAADGMVTTGVLLEQTGYALAPAPFFVTVGLAGAFGADTAVPTTLAWAEPGATYLDGPISTRCDEAGRVSGTKILVPDLAGTTHAVVTTTSGPRRIALADAQATPRSTIDGTRRLGELVLAQVPSDPLPVTDLAGARTRMLAGCAAEAVGVAHRVLELAVAHASMREQFGRVIGTYQAVSHEIANMYLHLELSRSLATWAAWAIDAGDPDAALAAASAKAQAGASAVRACEAAIQVHGGLGFTWDSVLHRYYKRALWLDAFEGGAEHQRATVAAGLLDNEARRQESR